MDRRRDLLILALITLVGLALRLVVWRWREFQALGGDEQEYFDQALRLLRERQYVELRLMRPPLYTLFLAASIRVVDSLVMNLRLVQALISAATVPLVYLLAEEVARSSGVPRRAGRRAGLVAAALAALSYTLAANATELLTETIFLAGLTGALWLLLRAARLASWRLAALAGLGVGALCLVRSVALPLLPLGAVWLGLLIGPRTKDQRPRVADEESPGDAGQALPARRRRLALVPALAYALAALLVILPWTARNYVVYGGLILIDTTGAENLWLDNDPAGREAVKAQLYALGEDRLARQQLAARRGAEVILADPGRFAAKLWGELLKLFALEQTDDMLARRAIWVSLTEIWARLLLGDALWLLMLLAGGYGLAVGSAMPSATASPDDGRRTTDDGRRTTDDGRRTTDDGQTVARSSPRKVPAGVLRSTFYALRSKVPAGVLRSTFYALRSPVWLLAPWALYVLLTTLLFHVELRYRLPLYPALLVYAGLALVQFGRNVLRDSDDRPQTTDDRRKPVLPSSVVGRRSSKPSRDFRRIVLAGGLAWRWVAALVPAICLALTLLHAPYPTLAWQLGWKHWHLGRAEAALAAGDAGSGRGEAEAALSRDESSALARVALARGAMAEGDLAGALADLDAALVAVPDHPQAHVLRGDVRRALGDVEGARADLTFETASRQDLQRWLWERATTPVPVRLDLGDGLDLGFVRGWHALAAGEAGQRWTTGRAELRLTAPQGARRLVLRLASGRPDGAAVRVEVWADGVSLGVVEASGAWAEVELPLSAPASGGELLVELRAPTFSPRAYDRASPDGRSLGVMVAWAEVR